MSLLDMIRAQQLQARKARDQLEIGVYTTLLSDILAVGKKFQREPNEAEAVAKVRAALEVAKENRLISKTNAQIAQYGREIILLTALMPTQMDEARLREVISAFRVVSPTANMGVIMKHLKDTYGGQYDGKQASVIVKEVLA